MSATVDCHKFSSYFNRCPVITIPGRTFPVEVNGALGAMKDSEGNVFKPMQQNQDSCGSPVGLQVSHLEDIVEQTGYVLERDSEYSQKILEEEEEITVSVTQKGGRTLQHQVSSSAQQLCSCPDCGELTFALVACLWLFQEVMVRDSGFGCDLGPDLDHFSNRTRQVLQFMNPNKINMDLLLELIAYIGTAPPDSFWFLPLR